MDEYADTVTSYINFAENICIPSKTVTVYSNNKPWFSKEVKILCLKKNEAFKSGNKEAFKAARYDLKPNIKTVCRLSYKPKTLRVFGKGCRPSQGIKAGIEPRMMIPSFLID